MVLSENGLSILFLFSLFDSGMVALCSLRASTHLEGWCSMKLEKYLLLVLVVFALIVIGTFLHKIAH